MSMTQFEKIEIPEVLVFFTIISDFLFMNHNWIQFIAIGKIENQSDENFNY